MKRLLSFILLSFCFIFNTHAENKHGPTWGVHGMLLFGNSEGMYVSHLPMFHAPHDYQVVLQIRCLDQQLDAAIKARLEQKLVLWTMEPEQFEIARLAADSKLPLKQFKANIVLGHFEQGGKTEYKDVAVIVEKTLIFRQLSPQMRENKQAVYHQIGSGSHRFLLKEIDSRPDFDHVLAITVPAAAAMADVMVKKTGLQAATDAEFLRVLQGQVDKRAGVKGRIYLDRADLE
ncbi:hypothetical protein [Undibacterium umbellatum]|uniref:Solute-binding protein family 3/N-terminal domain-containing protein n=1 Tax=Undibacterium umbellatum TaxID=2762300 RepID=A0ABR6Z9E9_9BURK|nr:hypothetical protein [Undibacterium umbellatum]MBC3907802.1 hypothetical protein [Undibacterium umbellatum]